MVLRGRNVILYNSYITIPLVLITTYPIYDGDTLIGGHVANVVKEANANTVGQQEMCKQRKL